MYSYLSGFRFKEPTGLGFYPNGASPRRFRSEIGGDFRDLHKWDDLTITRVPMGQGLSLNVLQIIQTWSAIANNGVIMQPYIVDRVEYADGRTLYAQPRVKATPIQPAAVAKMKEALKLVTQTGGTGKRAAVANYEVAGKTGTAQLYKPPDKAKGIPGGYSSSEYLASFVGFVPVENPRFLLLVSAVNPTVGSHTGGGASAPVFKRIAARTLEYLRVPTLAEEGRQEKPSADANASLAQHKR